MIRSMMLQLTLAFKGLCESVYMHEIKHLWAKDRAGEKEVKG